VLLVGYLVFAVRRSQRNRADKKELAGRPDSEVFGPVSARLPKALQGQVPEGEPEPAAPPAEPVPLASDPVAAPPDAVPAAPPPAPEVPPEPILPRLAAGISLPCDLGPLLDIAPRSSAVERVAFITDAFPGEVVQRELETTFEGLGGHISWFGPDLGVLRRDGLEANLALYTAPKSVFIDGAEAFPTASLGSVVVDLWVDADGPA
jgi:hypothetical protein